jgi:hypothetical protein
MTSYRSTDEEIVSSGVTYIELSVCLTTNPGDPMAKEHGEGKKAEYSAKRTEKCHSKKLQLVCTTERGRVSMR